MTKPINYAATMNAPKTVESLKAQGYEGADASLAVSLFEYNLAWKTEKEAGTGREDYKFLYRNPVTSLFSWSNFAKDADIKKEFNWIDSNGWDAVAATHGTTQDELLKAPTPQLIGDLFRYYGAENIFGNDYGPGMHIKGDDHPLAILSAKQSRALAKKERAEFAQRQSQNASIAPEVAR